MQFLSVDAVYLLKNEKMNKWGPQLFFMRWPGCPNDPKTEIPCHQKPLNAGMQDWVFRLELRQFFFHWYVSMYFYFLYASYSKLLHSQPYLNFAQKMEPTF